MSVSRTAQNWFYTIWEANWSPLRGKGNIPRPEGVAFVELMNHADTNERAFCTALNNLIEDRTKSERFNRTFDRPNLMEFKAFYFRALSSMRVDAATAADCDYCQNHACRYIVVHSHHTTGHAEQIITRVPENHADIRMYCYTYTVPCTCAAGAARLQREAARQKRQPMTPERRRRLLTDYSMTHRDASRLIGQYMLVRNNVYFGEPLQPGESDLARQLKAIIRKRVDTRKPLYRPKPKDPVADAWEGAETNWEDTNRRTGGPAVESRSATF